MVSWLLNVCYLALLAVLSPWIAYRVLVLKKDRAGWRQRLWGAVPARSANSASRPCVWLHAVSVGEVLQLQPVIDSLLESRPDLDIVISTTTATGQDVAQKKYAAHQVIFFPLDFSWACAAALDRIRPSLVALVELELWPNFLSACQRRDIPVALVNGRITAKSHQGYARIRPVARWMLAGLSKACVQNGIYASRFLDLGLDRARLVVTGSIKFDRVQTNRGNLQTTRLREAFGLAPDARVFIAGSTQDPEERLALESFLKLRRKHPALRLVLVPRHKERFDEVARLVTQEFGLPLLRRSAGTTVRDARGEPPILLLDTLGELAACWGLADVAFVGGSLTSRGGQNMIEPAGYGAAVMFGPNTQNFRDVVELLLASNAARVIRGGNELTLQLDEWLSQPEVAQAIGLRARDLALSQRATRRTVELLLPLLTGPVQAARRAA